MVAVMSNFSNRSANNREWANFRWMASSEGEGEGFSSYHTQPELDAEKVTALSRAVEFPTVGAVMVAVMESTVIVDKCLWPLLMVRRNRIEIRVSIIV